MGAGSGDVTLNHTGPAPSRPLLRYHGGKWRLAPWIIANFPPHRVYVEPFGGAASVLLRKPRSYSEVYNDRDEEIVNVFRVVREHGNALARAILWTPFARDEFTAAYEPTNDPIERARRLVVRAHLGFGSTGATSRNRTGFRSNVTRSNTTPAKDWLGQPASIRACARRFRGVVIDNRAAEDVVAQFDAIDTLFYCDPPYVADTRKGDSRFSCYRHEMTDVDHENLAAQLAGIRGMAVISGYHGALYDRLYADWNRVECKAFADGAAPRVEVLWFNAAAWKARRDESPLFAEPRP